MSARAGRLNALLTFLHISDIHFSVFQGSDTHDLEAMVRERMLDDIELMHGIVGDMDAVLLIGDVANKGAEDEYKIASAFLTRVCELVGCPEDRVICVPGNHDVDRTRHDAAHDAIRHQLRTIPPAQLSDTLHRLLRERPLSAKLV
jgi:3',5'-cyclic AMP phosphodiesterase CpdA